MSCNCNGSGCAGCCGTSVLSPCTVCAPNTAANETLSSVLDNFIAAFFGELTKTEVNGVVTWVLPCDLNVGLQNNPRLDDEGLACYFLRLFEDGITGLTGPRGFKGDAGTDGASGVCFLTSAFTQPTSLCPDITVTVDNPDLLAPEMYVWIPGSGYYQVVQIVGNSVMLTLITAVLSPNPSTPIDTPVIPAGAQGPEGVEGDIGPQGNPGLQGNPGSPGNDGADGTSVMAVLESTFEIPAIGFDTGVVEIDRPIGGFDWTIPGATEGQYVWVEGAGYFRLQTVTSTTQFTLFNPGYACNAAQGSPDIPVGALIFAMPPPAPTDISEVMWKAPVRVCTLDDGNIALTGLQTIDGVALSSGDRVLVCDQTAAEDNGIYVVSVAGWSRSWDCASALTMIVGIKVQAADELCLKYPNTVWTLTGSSGWSFGVDPAVFVQTNDFRPAYASVNYAEDGPAGVTHNILTANANTWESILCSSGSSDKFHYAKSENITVLDNGGTPPHAIPEVEIEYPGHYLVQFSAEASPTGDATQDLVRLGVFVNGALVNGGVCGARFSASQFDSVTLAGNIVLDGLQTGDTVALKSRNESAIRAFQLLNVNFTIHRVF